MSEINVITEPLARELISSTMYYVLKHCQYPEGDDFAFVGEEIFVTEYEKMCGILNAYHDLAYELVEMAITDELNSGTYAGNWDSLIEEISRYHDNDDMRTTGSLIIAVIQKVMLDQPRT